MKPSMKSVPRAIRVLLLSTVGACTDDDGTSETPADVAATEAAYDEAAFDGAMLDPGYYDDVDGLWYESGGAVRPVATIEARPATAAPAPLYGLLRGWGALFGSECVSATSNRDRDADGIPSLYAATFTCNGQVGGRTTSVTGRVDVLDADDTKANAGATVRFVDFAVSVRYASGARRTRTLDGAVSMVREGDAYRITQSYVEDLVVERPGAETVTAGLSRSGSAVFTPSSGNPVGSPFERGTLVGSGNTTATVNGVNYVLTRRTAPSLTWNRACREAHGSGFEAGSTLYDSDTGRDFEITWRGCTEKTLSFR